MHDVIYVNLYHSKKLIKSTKNRSNRSLLHYSVPSSVLLFGSFYKGFHFWERRKAMDANITFSRRLGRLLTNTSSALFILYGTLVVEITLYFTEVNQATPSSMHMCRVNCLYEELFLLLSMFPVSLFANSLKQNEGTRDILSWGFRPADNHQYFTICYAFFCVCYQAPTHNIESWGRL